MKKKPRKQSTPPELSLWKNKQSWLKNDPHLLKIHVGDSARKKIKIAKAGGEEEEI